MDRCQEKVIHPETVTFAVRNLPASDIIQRLADTYKALGDPSRLKIVLALLSCELCVCDLAAVCEMSESAVSHQLRILRNLNLVCYRKAGKVVFYQLIDDHIKTILHQSLGHVAEESVSD